MVVIPSFVSAQNTKFDEVFDSLMVIIKKIDRAKIVVQASLNEDSLATVQVAKANVELATTRTNEAMEKLFLAEEHKKETSAKISAEMENLIIFLTSSAVTFALILMCIPITSHCSAE